MKIRQENVRLHKRVLELKDQEAAQRRRANHLENELDYLQRPRAFAGTQDITYYKNGCKVWAVEDDSRWRYVADDTGPRWERR